MSNGYYIDEASGITARHGDNAIIADFYVKLIGINEYIKNDEFFEKKYLLQFYNPEYVGETEVDVKELEKFDYNSVDDSLLLPPTRATAAKELAYYIKGQSKHMQPTRIYLFDKLGWHKVEGRHCYCAGGTIIGHCPENYKVTDELSEKYIFDYDDSLSELECLKHVFKLFEVDVNVCPIVFTTGMLGVLRQPFFDAGIRVPCCLYVYGNSQTRKTTIVIFATALYGRSNFQKLSGVSTLRVSSSEFKTEECADALKDATFVYDDLYKDKDTRMHRDYEKRVRNIIRNFADNSPRVTTRSSHANNCQVAITAEYLLDTKTDVGRLYTVNVKKPIDSERLSECQKSPLALSAFYYHFIKWVADNYDTIVEKIRQEFESFRKYSTKHTFGYERLYEQMFLMQFAYGLLLDYAVEAGCIICDRKFVEEQFSNTLNTALIEQMQVIEKLEKREVASINFSAELLEMMEDKTIVLGKRGDECFIKDGYLYITSSHFGRCLCNKFKKEFSTRKITAYFRDRYISEVYVDNRQKKYNNKRYLKLNLAELNKDARDTSASIDNLFF